MCGVYGANYSKNFLRLISSDFCLPVSAITSSFCRSQTSEYFLVSKGFILLLLKHYIPFWTWVSGTIKYLPVSGHCMPFPVPVIFISSSTSSVHLFRSLPVVHVSYFPFWLSLVVAFFSFSFLSACPHKRVYKLRLYHYFAWYFEDEKRIFSSSSPCLFTK